jgi:hypothetical protein
MIIATDPTTTTELKETATATAHISNIFDVMQLDMPEKLQFGGILFSPHQP